ncbi:adenylyltransferase and sulfurtransferase [Planctomicrobium piriforme]|uniref:Adenylyltransferase and sulfurtransferase n=1 Tax=Planctomicrobium piriforme TaxID=1576369 RepID=A0A1I3C395_9PLAN|nr:adenylyltransferase and sulfurtransferase [Planctomicrobium piriforme]
MVVGCGALGSVIAESLARAGIGRLRLIDRDFVELSNLQRQVLYDETDVAERLPKAVAAARKLERINSDVVIEPHVADLSAGNILELLRGADVILDGTDNFETRFLVNDAAVELGIPWVHAGCVGSHGQIMTILPGQTPCLRCLMPSPPPPGGSETCDTAGVIGPAVNIVASLQVVDALKILTGQRELIQPVLSIVDVWTGSLRQMQLGGLNPSQCPCCGGTERLWLHGQQGSQSVILCGRNSVQIAPAGAVQFDFTSLANRLASLGAVKANPFLLTFRPSDSNCEMTLFRDGRAIIGGTEDLSEARSLYARYIGV